MNVKGVAFLGRQSMAVAEHGEPAWRTFMARQIARDPLFKQNILPFTLIPADTFIAFNEALIATFHGGDQRAYWAFGAKSAEWALTDGPYKGFFKPGDSRRFLFSGPTIWSTYFDAGKFEVQPGADAVDIRITGVPTPHVYIEYAVMGFLDGGLKVLGAHVSHEVIRSFAQGHSDVHYRFKVA